MHWVKTERLSSAGSGSAFRYQPFHILVAFICVLSLPTGVPVLSAQEPELIPNEKLDALVGPIALYPDPLLAQTLAASTYPLEVIQLQQWMANNRYLKDQALADAVEKQPWDPSVQAMAAFPDVVKLLSDNIAWMTDLGERLPRTASRCYGGSSADAREGSEERSLIPLQSRRYRCRPSKVANTLLSLSQRTPRWLRSLVRFNGGLWRSAYAYPTLSYRVPGILQRGRSLGLRCWYRLGARPGRQLGLRMQVGERRYQDRQQQQIRKQFEQEHQLRQPPFSATGRQRMAA